MIRYNTIRYDMIRYDDVTLIVYHITISIYLFTGTTWLSEMVSGIMNNGDIDQLRKFNLHVRVKWLEVESGHWKVRYTIFTNQQQ